MPGRESQKTAAERERIVQTVRALVNALAAADPQLQGFLTQLTPILDDARRAPVSGWRMALNDMMALVSDLSAAERSVFELRLREQAYSWAAIRAEFQARPIAAILQRGRIRNEEEYHLLREIADDMDAPAEHASTAAEARRLIAQYESALRNEQSGT
jgi:hypothetical protein